MIIDINLSKIRFMYIFIKKSKNYEKNNMHFTFTN